LIIPTHQTQQCHYIGNQHDGGGYEVGSGNQHGGRYPILRPYANGHFISHRYQH
jgi:hypothetical protein